MVVLALIFSLIVSNPSEAAESCSSLNVATLADDNLTVTMLSMNIVEKTGSYQLTINYKLANMTPDKKIDEGTFKLFFTDGSSTPQYGFFGSFFPSDSRERSYTWEYLKTLTPMNISYNSGFFSSEPSSLKLNWAPPGFGCNLISPAVKAAADAAAAKAAADKAAAAADKAAADAKAASDKLAAAKIVADKAAADKAAADKAAAAADKAAADAKAASDKLAAAKIVADKAAADKAAADKAAAEANRREQTISISPLVSGSILLSASGFPVKVSSTSNLSVFAYTNTNNVCEFANGLIETKTSGRCVIAFSQEGNLEFKPATNFILDFSIMSAAKTTTITCTKGKLIKKVTAVKPKCPVGYKVKK